MKFENQTFTTDVTLDCNEFINCEFKNCVVFFQGGPFSLVNTKFTNVKFGIAGAAQGTLEFLRLVRANGPQLVEEFLRAGPQPQGTMTPTITN